MTVLEKLNNGDINFPGPIKITAVIGLISSLSVLKKIELIEIFSSFRGLNRYIFCHRQILKYV